MILFDIEIDDRKGSKQTFQLQDTKEKNPVTFKWVDDIDYMCDWGELSINVPFGLLTGGYEGDLSIPPITGTELIKISFGEQMTKDKGHLELEFDIYKILEKPGGPDAKYMSSTFVLINSRMAKLLRPEKSRSWSKSYSAVAMEIAQEAGFKNIIVENTQGLAKPVRQLYWSDADLLSFMVENSVGAQGSVPYLWHVSGDNFHYHSYEYPQHSEA